MNSGTTATLQQLREQVDNIDAQLIALLKERLRVTTRMRDVKKRQATPLRDPQRESVVLERIEMLNKECLPHLPAEQLHEVYKTIMNWSLAAQQEPESNQSSSRSQ
ncbi:MAG: chorismate mutase [Silvanigrellaceae bacterium]